MSHRTLEFLGIVGSI